MKKSLKIASIILSVIALLQVCIISAAAEVSCDLSISCSIVQKDGKDCISAIVNNNTNTEISANIEIMNPNTNEVIATAPVSNIKNNPPMYVLMVINEHFVFDNKISLRIVPVSATDVNLNNNYASVNYKISEKISYIQSVYINDNEFEEFDEDIYNYEVYISDDSDFNIRFNMTSSAYSIKKSKSGNKDIYTVYDGGNNAVAKYTFSIMNRTDKIKELDLLIFEAQQYDSAIYTDKSVSNLRNALYKADKLKQKPSIELSEFENIEELLKNAVSSMKLKYDVDCNGNIDIDDVTSIQKYLANIPTNCDLDVADANKDGFVTIDDVTYIQMLLAHII